MIESSMQMTTMFPKKVYLNGSDCFHLMMNRNQRKLKEGNNQIVYCIEFRAVEGIKQVTEQIQNSPFLHWLNNCKIHEPQIGVPYLFNTSNRHKVTIENIGVAQEKLPHAILQQSLCNNKHHFFQFYTYQYQSNYFLMVVVDHVLFDGKGAGMLIEHIKGNLNFTPETIDQLFPKKPKWRNSYLQWKNLIYVKRTIEQTTKGNIAYLERKYPQKTGFGLLTHQFSASELQQIKENAQQSGVRFGINLFQLACICKAYRNLLTTSDEIWFPVPYNGRKRGAQGSIISNYTSFIFHRIKATKTTTLREIVSQLQEQMNAQIANELPLKYNHLLQLMRYFPTWFNQLVTTKSSKKNIASFLYSSTEMTARENDSEFKNQWIIPPFSFPPGLTINFYTQNNSLHFNIAYSNIVLTEEKALKFKQQLIQLMLEK